MHADEQEQTLAVWRAANAARGTMVEAVRVTRVREKLVEEGSTTYIAVCRGEIVGMALSEPGRADDGAGPVLPEQLHVSMVFVHPSAQRHGVGGALMRHVLNTALTQGIRTVSLWTAVGNSGARRLYESVGMVSTRSRRVASGLEWVRYELTSPVPR